MLLHCTSSEPLLASSLNANVNNNDDSSIIDSIWFGSSSHGDSNESDAEDKDSKELPQVFSRVYAIYNEHDENNRPSSSSPVRRANFWKRSNFWRKRANFWRRDIAS
jgi:hypothetical protein